MGIKFRCHACDKKLHVKSFLAGKRGVCPKCGAKVRIPPAMAKNRPRSDCREARPTSRPMRCPPAHGRHHGSSPAAVSTSRRRARRHSRFRGLAHAPLVRGPDLIRDDPIAEAPDAVWYVRPPTGGQFGPADGTDHAALAQ